MQIWLRTGNNQDMIDVVQVSAGLNGATATSFVRPPPSSRSPDSAQTWTVPQLNATGPIYFYGASEQ